MKNQLTFIDEAGTGRGGRGRGANRRDWRRAEQTTELGRQGVAAARAALEAAARRSLDHASRFPAA